MKKGILTLILIIAGVSLSAQQDPQYTQYMYNMNIVNPAYVGVNQGVSIGLLYRRQWLDLEGAPNTGTLSVYSRLGERVGGGLSIISDRIGPVKETNTYADLSYTIPVGKTTKLAFGLKTGATFHKIGIGALDIIDQGDPFFSQNINSTTFNIGAGLYFYKPNRFYVSVAMPNILNATHLVLNDKKIGSETQHLFAATGYVFKLSENFSLKPHMLLKLAFKAPLSYDVNLNLFIYNIIEIGVGYRLDDAFTGMINFAISPALKIGYAYDAIQSELNINTNASHEIFINFNINMLTKVSRSPRYF